MPPISCNNFLAELFRSHSISVKEADGWLLLPNGMHAAANTGGGENLHKSTTQLNVCLKIGPAKVIVESFGGFGETQEDCIRDAFKHFADGALHVFLAALFNTGKSQVNTEEWTIDGVKRQATIGGAIVRTFCGPIPVEELQIKEHFEKFQQLLQGKKLNSGIHWARLYFAQNNRSLLACEVLIDNELDENLQREMANSSWTWREEFYSIRWFLMIKGGVDIHSALAVFCANKDCNDNGMVNKLIASGIPRDMAERINAFAPIAFGRVLIGSLIKEFPPTAMIRTDDGKTTRLQLDSDPIYSDLMRIAKDGFNKGLISKDEFSAIALRSAEVNALNQALNAGSKPEDLRFTESIIFLSNLIADSKPITKTYEDMGFAKKPWWKFWAH